jgi:predicted ATPase/transcriptional regulator with XRE-family HTH domain
MVGDGSAPFGALLRWYRLRAGLSQEALAARARLSARGIIALERGQRTSPRSATLDLLAAALGLGPEERATFVAAARPVRAAGPAVTGAGGGASEAPALTLCPLPDPPTALIGREHEVAAALRLMRAGPSRLLTLTGPGGIGKTRLALAVAVAARDFFPDGVAFVDLAPVHEHAAVAAAIARAVGLRESGAQRASTLLVARLRTRRTLLVLDNFEQVVDAAHQLAGLLAACPFLTLLVTSRIALGLRGEQRFVVPPLALPGPEPSSRSQPESFAAVQFFVERARAVGPEFALDERNAGAVVEVCRRLDGLPLALELAAARVAVLPPAALLDHLGRRLDLPRGPRDLPERQQTLRATLDWSYALLDPAEQQLFARLGVFAGGWTLEAAEAICHPNGALEVLQRMAALMENSLLVRMPAALEPRYGLLETLRDYARERLAALGEEEEVRQRHAMYYLALAEAALPEITGPRPAGPLERLEEEHDNMRVALRWALRTDPYAERTASAGALAYAASPDSGERGAAEAGMQERLEVGLRLAGAMWRFWLLHSHLTEGRRWLEAALAQGGPAAPELRAGALRGAALLAFEQNDLTRSVALCEEAAALYRALGDARGIADIANQLGNAVREQGDYARAKVLYEESLAWCRGADDRLGVAIALNNLGTTARYQGELERAAALYAESLALRRPIADQRGIAMTLRHLGDVAHRRGDPEGARALCLESLDMSQALGDRQGSARTLMVLASIARAQGCPGQARAWYAEGLTLGRSVDDVGLAIRGLEGLAAVATDQGQAIVAARLFGAAAAQRALLGAPLLPPDQADVEREVAVAQRIVPRERFLAAWAEGEALSLEQAISEARRAGG